MIALLRIAFLPRVLTAAFAVALQIVPGSVSAQAIAPASNDAWLDQEYRAKSEQYRNHSDFVVKRGLVADRKHNVIDLLAVATGTKGPVDTLLTSGTGDSSRSIAVSAASQADIRAALEFIGMSPGHPIDLAQNLYWPKGERVVITVSWGDAHDVQPTHSVRAENLLLDLEWNEPLPTAGWRFVGVAGARVETAGALPIATAFNAQNTLLEVPYLAGGPNQVGQIAANPGYSFANGQKLRIRIRPEFRDGQMRVHDFVAVVAPGAGAEGMQLSGLLVKLESPDGNEIVSGNFESVFVYLDKLIEDGKEPYVKFRFADELTMQSVRNIARFTERFLIPQQIWIEPDPGHLFYSALLPQETWRDPRQRSRGSQPLEIHLRDQTNSLTGELIQHPNAGGNAVKQLPFENVQEFTKALELGGPWQTDGVFLMLGPEFPYGQARGLYERIRVDFPNVYVFL